MLDSRGAALTMTATAMGWTFAVSLWFGAATVGGSDSYGYVSQAALFARGRLTDTVPMRPEFRWPYALQTLTPIGYKPATPRGVIAPTYPPGLPLVMTPMTWLPEPAVFLIVPLFGLLGVWLCYGIGKALGDPLAGIGAVLLAASPTFLFQVLQPMSDVPAMACWLAALFLAMPGTDRGAARAGAVAALAILIRSNLAPLAAIVAMAAAGAANGRDRFRTLSAFFAPVLVGLVLLGWIQNVRFGSLFSSGYESFESLFSVNHIVPNLRRYPRWLIELHTWFIAIWLVVPLWIARQSRAVRRFVWAAFAFTGGVVAYLPYLNFGLHEWSYTRFMLPAIPMMLLFGAALVLTGVRQLPGALRAVMALSLFGALTYFFVQTAWDRGVFAIRPLERRYSEAAGYVRERLPKDAFILAAQHSGSVRYYGQRPILRWDLMSRGSLDGAVATRARPHAVRRPRA